jgi:hypothetical protein
MTIMTTGRSAILLLTAVGSSTAFAPPVQRLRPTHVDLSATKEDWNKFVASAVLAVSLVGAAPVWADEIGRETEAPTLFTGESVMVRYFEKKMAV